MLHLHAHWQPPLSPADPGGVLFWAETSEAPPPPWQRGRLPQKPKPRPHPFCAPLQDLEPVLGGTGAERSLTLRLPSTRSGPRPAPGLIHAWDLDEDTPPWLAPWVVAGWWLAPAEACGLLLELPDLADIAPGWCPYITLGDDARFWGQAAALVLETLAAQKLVPVLAPAGPDGNTYHARWLPVLDGPADGPRLACLESAMPPICRAALPASAPGKQARSQASPGNDGGTPRSLLFTFLNTTCDALARRWGGRLAPRFQARRKRPGAALAGGPVCR